VSRAGGDEFCVVVSLADVELLSSGVVVVVDGEGAVVELAVEVLVARPPLPSVMIASHTLRNTITAPAATQPRIAAMRGWRLVEDMATGWWPAVCTP
jgi:hypothetical protein